MDPFGFTRSILRRSYALITPQSHVIAPLPNWIQSQGIVLVAPAVGAEFSQYTALMQAGSQSGQPLQGVERFAFVEEGVCTLDWQGTEQSLSTGHFAFMPAGSEHTFRSQTGCRLNVFEKPYKPNSVAVEPEPIVGSEVEVRAEPFMGDPDAMLKTLLPDQPEYDMAVNLFTFKPGAALPMVEVHVMEHGLLMLQGKGIYRLADDWHPVQQGDVIWIAPFCPQWFTAVGKEPARYLYYKNINRDPLAELV